MTDRSSMVEATSAVAAMDGDPFVAERDSRRRAMLAKTVHATDIYFYEFHETVKLGDLPKLMTTLARRVDIDPNGVTAWHENPLATAVSSGDLDVVRFLLTLGADPNADNGVSLRGECCATALHTAVEMICPPNLDLLRLLLDSGADVNARYFGIDPGGRPIHAPICSLLLFEPLKALPATFEPSHFAALDLFLSYGLDLNMPQALPSFAMWAAYSQNVEMLKWALDRGARFADGEDPFSWYNGDDEIFQCLINSGHAHLNLSALSFVTYGPEWGLTKDAAQERIEFLISSLPNPPEPQVMVKALCAAVRQGDYLMTKLWIERGVDINGIDGDQTPLLVAISHLDQISSDLFLVVLLLEKGADVNCQKVHRGLLRNGHSPLHEAALQHNPRLLRILLAAGADTEARSSSNQIPLHCVANNLIDFSCYSPEQRPYHERVLASAQLLVGVTRDIDAVDAAGYTVLHYLVLWLGKPTRGEMASILLDRGVSTDVRNNEGLTAPELCQQRHGVTMDVWMAVGEGPRTWEVVFVMPGYGP
ncbi:hypothetical protein MAPG_09550 [Magnaporthiopsis poae ATCC 64411]|uniref:Ankyrin repeat protein n=1 Tax=Magnaporthiopsis poae (strain ATCC 64411 / 73-15) TaxID=644358 RepID=A0A0C4EA91_MAGP6|nr:hypothetical protein MAPG_09550 [Magnaporthiopsis poae ATCC 64411]